MKQRIYNVSPAPLWKDSPNYPGVPTEAATVKQSTAKVTYEQFVTDYAATMARRGATFTAGMLLAVGGAINIQQPALMYVVVGAGVVLAAYGVIGLVTTHRAHEDWYRYGIGVSMTVMQPERTEATPAARPFVPSENGTIRVGKFRPEVLRALLNTANSADKVTRDGAVGKVPRQLYGDGKWGETLAELMRLDMIDGDGRLTERGRDYRAGRPHPDMMTFARTHIDRPTGDPDATDRDDVTVGEWE